MSEKLTGKQARALESLLQGDSIRKAALLANVNERTIYRWLESGTFAERLKAQEGRVLDSVSVRLMGLAGKALDVLSDILESDTPAKGANIKRLAAQSVLDAVHSWLELRSFEERLSRLESLNVKSKR